MERGYRLTLHEGFIEQLREPLFKKRRDGSFLRVNQTLQLAMKAKGELNSLNDETLNSLSEFILSDGSVNGDVVLDQYFPSIDADIFISHSHTDLNLALALSQWLKEEFGLVAFVDSTIWGSGDELIRRLDDKYCFQPEKGTYNYHTRNLTTSFIHLMLASAISKMIDSCSCLMFLNSPNSLSGNPAGNKTGSPWIFYELFMAKLLRKSQLREQAYSQGGRINESISFVVKNTVPVDSLSNLSIGDLKTWQQLSPKHNPQEALATLYRYYPG